jgi:hypothetical protein
MEFHQQTNLDEQFIVLGNIKRSNPLALAEFTIFTMPVQDNAIIIGAFKNGDIEPKIKINGMNITNVGSEMFSSVFLGGKRDGLVQVDKIIGNVDFIPEKFIISHYGIKPHIRSLSSQMADGIDFKLSDYPEILDEVSGLSGAETWGRWTDALVSPEVRIHFRQYLPKNFTLEINAEPGANEGLPVKVRIGEQEDSFIIKNADTPNKMMADTIEIIPQKTFTPHEIDSKNMDMRKLGIGLITLKVYN